MSPVYQGFARQAARGRVRVRQFANWHLTAGMVPQGSVLSKWHGRLGSASLGLACFGRQRSMGKDYTPPHGRRRDAYQGSICSGMTTHGRSGLEGDLWRLPAGSALHGTVKRHGRHGLQRHGLNSSGLSRQAAQPVAWISPSRQARCGQTYKVWPGFTSQGRNGVTSPGEAGSTRSRWLGTDYQDAAGKASPRFGGNARRHKAGTVQHGSATRPTAGTTR